MFETWLSAGRYYAGRASLRHYLFRVAPCILGDHIRKRRRQLPQVSFEQDANAGDLPDDRSGLETLLSRLAGLEIVHAVIPQIAEAHREAVRLSLEGLDTAQIAEAIGVCPNTARSRLSRGRRQLRALVEAALVPQASSSR